MSLEHRDHKCDGEVPPALRPFWRGWICAPRHPYTDGPVGLDIIWDNVGVSLVNPTELVPTQELCEVSRLQAHFALPRNSLSHRPLHIICYEGVKYLYDGHHRWIGALARGEERIRVRQIYVSVDGAIGFVGPYWGLTVETP